MGFKRSQRVFVVRGHENNRRHHDRAQSKRELAREIDGVTAGEQPAREPAATETADA